MIVAGTPVVMDTRRIGPGEGLPGLSPEEVRRIVEESRATGGHWWLVGQLKAVDWVIRDFLDLGDEDIQMLMFVAPLAAAEANLQATIARSALAADLAAADAAMARAQLACPGGNCLQLSTRTIAELGQGEILTVYPTARGPLPTLPSVPGVPPSGWSHHVVVRLPGGGVGDPSLGVTYNSVADFLLSTFSGPVSIP